MGMSDDYEHAVSDTYSFNRSEWMIVLLLGKVQKGLLRIWSIHDRLTESFLFSYVCIVCKDSEPEESVPWIVSDS